MKFLDYAALLAYFGIVLGIGAWCSRGERTSERYFRGSRSIPWWAAGLSIFATQLSAITFVAIPAKAFATDWTFFIANLGMTFVAPIVIAFYLPFFCRLEVASAYEYLERRFNLGVRWIASLSFILLQLGRMSIQVLLPALALSTVVGISFWLSILVVGLLTTIYCMAGGIEAVVWTDVLQSVLLLGAALLCLVLILTGIDGGVGRAIEIGREHGKFHLVNWTWDSTAASPALWVVVVGNLLSNLIPYTADQAVIQKYLITRDERQAARSIWVNAGLGVVASLLFFSLGTALFVYYRTHPGLLDPSLPADAVFPLFMSQRLPAGLLGFVVAGLFSASMSTLSAGMSSVSTAIVTDFYRRLRPAASDRSCVRLAIWTTAILGLLSMGAALLISKLGIASVWDASLELLGLTGGCLAGLFALGMFTRRAHGTGALAGAVAGMVATLAVRHYTSLHFFLYAGTGIVTCFVTGYLFSLVIPGKIPSLEGLTWRLPGLGRSMRVGALLILSATLSGGCRSVDTSDREWSPVAQDVWRSRGMPAGYAIIDGPSALLIGAPTGLRVESLRRLGIENIELALLTHHHRDSSGRAAELIALGIPVRAPRESAPWITPEGVREFWRLAMPPVRPEAKLKERRASFKDWEYLVHPEGIEEVRCDLEDGQTLTWQGWTLTAVAAPGHSRDHMAFLARRPASPILLFAGDALAAAGKMWAPYTTDWDHWKVTGQEPAAASLRKMTGLHPDIVLPEHGPPITRDAVGALLETARNVEEVAFLKSFERYTKDRLGQAPPYRFLSPAQRSDLLQTLDRASRPPRSWSQLSEHLFVSGNTWVVASRDGSLWVHDPYWEDLRDWVGTLAAERKLGSVEIYTASHAHSDHYAGIHRLPTRSGVQVWTLDRVAEVISDPFFFRAPFVDVQPLPVDRRFRDGETVTWHEYRLRFHHFPGQTTFHMAVEAEIDGKRCLFTGDNFYHQDQFTGSGGWTGMNRGLPPGYARSAASVLAMKPDWILAEHGGAFEFSEEDWRRRVRWAQAASAAADRLSPTGDHRRDWDPHRIRVEPFLLRAKSAALPRSELVIANPLDRPETLTIELEGRGLLENQRWEMTIPAGGTARHPFEPKIIGRSLPAGRHVFAIRAATGDVEDGSDAFFVVEIGG